MKKFFDKYVAQSSRGQIAALSVLFAVLVSLGALVGRSVAGPENEDNVTAFGRPETWGLMQCVDGGFVQATIGNNTKVEDGRVKEPAPVSVILLSLGFWLGGMILVSFFTGAATDFLNSRREKILSGSVDYTFRKNYVLIVGFDFQVKNLVRKILTERRDIDVALVTDASVEDIYAEMMPEFEDAEDLTAFDAKRLFVMRKDMTSEKTYRGFRVSGAAEIYLMGDGTAFGRDGKTLKALETLARQAYGEGSTSSAPVKVYVHIEDSVLYSQVRAMELPADGFVRKDGTPIFDLEIFNYYESWAWECWSNKASADGGEAYLPLRHVEGSRSVELFVIGAGRMGRAMVNYAMPLMNYGEDGKHCRITVFDPDVLKKGFFADRATLAALPEVDVLFREMDGCSDEANDIMLEAARRPATSVTVVVALSDPDAAIRAYSELSNQLRRENVSVLVWQATRTGTSPDKKYLKMGGADAVADRTCLRYFGMTDELPWKNPLRFACGMAVNYYYNCWFPWGQPQDPEAPCVMSADFLARSRAMWQKEASSSYRDVVAGKAWDGTKRWKKWSSVNSGDSFREKALLFRNVPYAEAAGRVLKAEHNRWWTERLLAGWTYDPAAGVGDGSHQDKSLMLHGDMVPFEELAESVKEKDKINIAAMAAFGFV